MQLQNDGNYEGEGSNTPGSTTWIGDFPEIFIEPRYYPDGRLQNFQRNRFRLWTIYNMDMGAGGDLAFSGLWRVEGARAYSLAARNQGLTATQRTILAANGYTDEPAAAHIFFNDERGTEQFPGYGLLDLSVNYNIPVFKSLRPWIKVDLYNVLDNRKLIAFDTTVSQNNAGAKDSVGLATTFNKGANFGKATGNTQTNVSTTGINSFPLAFQGAPAGGRTFRMALGFRF